MITDANKVLFLQPLIHKFGLNRTHYLQDMFKKLDEKLDATEPCSVTAVLAPKDCKFANAEQNVSDPCIQFILAKLLADVYGEKMYDFYKAKGWSDEQIGAQLETCLQMEHAIRYQLQLTPRIQEKELQGVPSGMVDAVLDILGDIKKKIDEGETEGEIKL